MKIYNSIGIGFFAKVISIGSNLIVLPFIMSSLNNFEFSLWMIFISFYSLIALFDFGFSATISRYYSYAHQGLNPTMVKCIDEITTSSNKSVELNRELFSNVTITNKKLFNKLTLIAMLVLMCIYLYYTHVVGINLGYEYKLSWFIFSLSIVVLLMSVRSNGLLHGMGLVSQLYKNTILSNIVFFSTSILLLNYGSGILGLCVARLLSSISMLLLNEFYRNKFITSNSLTTLSPTVNEEINKVIINKSIRLGAGGLGNYLNNRTTILLISSLFAIGNIANISFVINVSITILSGCLIVVNNMLPVFVKFRTINDTVNLKRALYKTYFLSSFLYLLAYVLFVLVAKLYFIYSNSEINFPSSVIILLCFLIFYFEMILSISIAFISTKNDVYFYKYQIISGFIFLVGSYLLSFTEYLSIESVLLFQLFVQIMYNYWKWPLESIREFSR